MGKKRISDSLTKANENVLIFGLIATILVLFIQIIARTFFDTAFAWVEEVARYLFVFFIFGGTAQAFKHGLFISVNVINGFLPERGKKVLDIVMYILTIVFFVYVSYLGYKLFSNSKGQLTPALQVPIRWVYLTFPVFFLQSTYYAVMKLIGSFKGTETASTEMEEK